MKHGSSDIRRAGVRSMPPTTPSTKNAVVHLVMIPKQMAAPDGDPPLRILRFKEADHHKRNPEQFQFDAADKSKVQRKACLQSRNCGSHSQPQLPKQRRLGVREWQPVCQRVGEGFGFLVGDTKSEPSPRASVLRSPSRNRVSGRPVGSEEASASAQCLPVKRR